MSRFNYQPIFVAAILFIPMMALLSGFQPVTCAPKPQLFRPLRIAGTIIAVLYVTGYVFMLCLYVGSPTHLDHIEPAIVSIAHQFQIGQPVYHDLDAPQRYSLLYGPMTYISYSVAMWLLPPGWFSCKLLAALASLSTICFGALCLRKSVSSRNLILVTGLLVALFMAHAPNTFWTRADPLISACVAFALWAVVTRKPGVAAASVAFALGIAANLKMNAPLYFIFPLLLLFYHAGIKTVCHAVLGAGVVSLLPFLLPNVSFHNWLRILLAAGRHGPGFNEICWSAQWFIFLLMMIAGPWLVFRLARGDAQTRMPITQRNCLAGLFVSLVAAALFATKAGSDPTQIMPLIPLLLYACCWVVGDLPVEAMHAVFAKRLWFQSLAATFVMTALVLAGYQWNDTVTSIHQQNPFSRALRADLADIMAALPRRTICMGCGLNRSEFKSNHFLPLVLANQPYLLDPVAIMEFDKAGISLPEASREIIRNETVDVWLIPKGEPPFAMFNWYSPHRPLFDGVFQQVFKVHYQKAGVSRFFDVYLRKTAFK